MPGTRVVLFAALAALGFAQDVDHCATDGSPKRVTIAATEAFGFFNGTYSLVGDSLTQYGNRGCNLEFDSDSVLETGWVLTCPLESGALHSAALAPDLPGQRNDWTYKGSFQEFAVSVDIQCSAAKVFAETAPAKKISSTMTSTEPIPQSTLNDLAADTQASLQAILGPGFIVRTEIVRVADQRRRLLQETYTYETITTITEDPQYEGEPVSVDNIDVDEVQDAVVEQVEASDNPALAAATVSEPTVEEVEETVVYEEGGDDVVDCPSLDAAGCASESQCEVNGNNCINKAISSGGQENPDFFTFEISLELEIPDATTGASDDILSSVLEALNTDAGAVDAPTIVIDDDTGLATVSFVTVDSELSTNALDMAASGALATETSTALLSTDSASLSVASVVTESAATLGLNEVPAIPTTGGSLASECSEGELLVNGYVTGQAIALDYDATALKIDGDDTVLETHFTVPRRYTQMYQESTFSISWHDRDQPGPDRELCYTNRASTEECPAAYAGWTVVQRSDNACFDDVYVDLNWSDIMVNGKFRTPAVTQGNGEFIEIFLVADVEQWAYFDASSFDGLAGSDGEGVYGNQMTVFNSGHYSDTFFSQSHDFNTRTLHIIDERYTFSQIPFTIRFPMRVVVETSLTVGTDITMLTALVRQQTVDINLNPSEAEGYFAYVDVEVETRVQYPYALRPYKDSDEGGVAAAQVLVKDDMGNIDPVDGIQWMDMEDKGVCADVKNTEMCSQTMKFRVYPLECSANAEFTVKAWVECFDEDSACGVDDKWMESQLSDRETSNTFVTFDFATSTASFCPEVLDEFRIKATAEVYRDELFTDLVTDDSVSDTRAGSTKTGETFSNDWLYFRFKYEGYSDAFDGGADAASAELIDFTRPISIWMDVDMPSESQQTNPTAIDDDIVNFVQAGGSTQFTVKLCDTTDFPADTITWSADSDRHGGELISCFDEKIYGNAELLLDFHPIYELDGAVGEKEVAFGMRLDERVIPVDNSDNEDSNVKITVRAEVYWKGNRHTTRRLLQISGSGIDTTRAPAASSSQSVNDIRFRVRSKGLEAQRCDVPPTVGVSHANMWVTMPADASPNPVTVLDFVYTLQYQLASKLGYDDMRKLQIETVAKCSTPTTCSDVIYLSSMENTRRRLQNTDGTSRLYIRVSMQTDASKTGGMHAMAYQELVFGDENELSHLSALNGASMYKSTIDECGMEVAEASTIVSAKLETEEKKSGAYAPASFFCGLFAIALALL